jgi:integrase
MAGHRSRVAGAHGARSGVRRRLRFAENVSGASSDSSVEVASRFVDEWRERGNTVEPSALVFSTRSGKAISPNNVLRRAIFPACEALNLPRATWLTFRRTYSSWSHDKGVPGKVIAQLMGHANVDTTLNVYTQVLDGALRTAVERIGTELFTIVREPGSADTANAPNR